MTGRFLTGKDMSAAKHEMEAFNSLVKRGELETTKTPNDTIHVVCGCGAEGCIFISARHKRDQNK